MSRNKMLSIIAVFLFFSGAAFPLYSSSLYDWSISKQNSIAEKQFKIQCPNYPDPELERRGIADECGRNLYGNIGPEYTIAKFSSLVAVICSLILGAIVARRVSVTRRQK